jgi:DNA-binding transcriptional ArsR family regulator
MTDQSRQVITDARAMRAMAHPLRVQLMELIVRDGEITATRAAEALGESPGNMSWHLQTLAKYGYIEEAGAGRGRSRPWCAVSHSRSFEIGVGTETDVASAGEALAETFLARTFDRLREWWSLRFTYPEKWRRAAFITDSFAYLTPEELTSIMEEIAAIYRRFDDRRDLDKRPGDPLAVQLYAHGHPLPPTPSGN